MSSLTDFLTFLNTSGNTKYFEFTESGTWTKPDGITYVYVEAIGGGGGGSNQTGNSYNSSGGGGGGFNCKLFLASDLDDSIDITVGAGGAGKSAGSDGNGANGGDSSFGNYLVAKGGKGGAYSFFASDNISYSMSGSGACCIYNGTTNRYYGCSDYAGGAGGCKSRGGNAVKGGGGGGGSGSSKGSGGISIDAGNGGSGNTTSNVKADDGQFPGGGGGSSANDGGGGNGADGVVRIWCW